MSTQLINSQKQRLDELNTWLKKHPEHPDRVTVFRDKLKLETDLGLNKWIGITKKMKK